MDTNTYTEDADGNAIRFYTNPDVLRFVADLEEEGWDVEHYCGRYFWEGPAVRVGDSSERAEVQSLVSVPTQFDQLGRGYIVYPVAKDTGAHTADEQRTARAKMEKTKALDLLATFFDEYYLIEPESAEDNEKLSTAVRLLGEVWENLRNAP